MSYVNVLGQEGNYQRYSLVYGKKDQKCTRNDGGVIKRIVLGVRGTFYCPVCHFGKAYPVYPADHSGLSGLNVIGIGIRWY